MLQALEELDLYIPIEAIHQGLQTVSVPGRFQVIPGKVTTILDVAHNPASARLLAENLKKKMSKVL